MDRDNSTITITFTFTLLSFQAWWCTLGTVSYTLKNLCDKPQDVFYLNTIEVWTDVCLSSLAAVFTYTEFFLLKLLVASVKCHGITSTDTRRVFKDTAVFSTGTVIVNFLFTWRNISRKHSVVPYQQLHNMSVLLNVKIYSSHL
jgi:hypothetical protein